MGGDREDESRERDIGGQEEEVGRCRGERGEEGKGEMKKKAGGERIRVRSHGSMEGGG